METNDLCIASAKSFRKSRFRTASTRRKDLVTRDDLLTAGPKITADSVKRHLTSLIQSLTRLIRSTIELPGNLVHLADICEIIAFTVLGISKSSSSIVVSSGREKTTNLSRKKSVNQEKPLHLPLIVIN